MTKIMLVEDDKSLREIYSIRLVAEGYDIVSAGDGEEALSLAVQEKPDLIISDVMMPKISGFDMLDILRSTKETQSIKVIIMTALSSDEQRQRSEALGAEKHLVKSQCGIEDVVNAVHEVLGDAPTTNAQANIATLNATGTPEGKAAAVVTPVTPTAGAEAQPGAGATPEATQPTSPAPQAEPMQPPVKTVHLEPLSDLNAPTVDIPPEIDVPETPPQPIMTVVEPQASSMPAPNADFEMAAENNVPEANDETPEVSAASETGATPETTEAGATPETPGGNGEMPETNEPEANGGTPEVPEQQNSMPNGG